MNLTIPFTVPERANVTVEVYNMLGKRITTLVDDKAYSAGHHNIRFDGTGLASGVYLYKFKADGVSGKTFSSTKRLTIIK